MSDGEMDMDYLVSAGQDVYNAIQLKTSAYWELWSA